MTNTALIIGASATAALLVNEGWQVASLARRPAEQPGITPVAADLQDPASLDVAKNWTPTVDSYLGRVTKAHITAAVTEGVAARITDMKKLDMAQAAEQLLASAAAIR